ncbi:hypothetical protein LA06_18550, partial [Xanthomonas oryzae pv. oryzae]
VAACLHDLLAEQGHGVFSRPVRRADTIIAHRVNGPINVTHTIGNACSGSPAATWMQCALIIATRMAASVAQLSRTPRSRTMPNDADDQHGEGKAVKQSRGEGLEHATIDPSKSSR